MSNYRKTWSLIVFYATCVLLAGCFPEDSLQWSSDGRVGLLRSDDALYLVDGQSGRLTQIAAEKVSPWPDISKDGSQIVYSEEVKCLSLLEGLRALPPGQVKMIENHAGLVRARVLRGELSGNLQTVSEEQFGYVEPYRYWVLRYMCENADKELTERLGRENLEKGKKADLSFFRLIVVSRDDLESKKVIATSVLMHMWPRFSPSGKHIAYLMIGPKEYARADLYVASTRQHIKAMRVASHVALGYDWRQDGRALACLCQEADDSMLGVIQERMIDDDDGKLLAEPLSAFENGSFADHECSGTVRPLAGTLFQPLTKIQYGLSGRVFFSSPSGSLPTSDLDEPEYSLFCYDSVTKAVANVLPASVSASFGETINFFSLSPDGRKVLLPMEYNRFAIYTLGAKSAHVPIKEAEQFGDDNMPDMLPAWKGNMHISSLVAQSSRFLPGEGQRKGDRHEIVVLGTEGDFQSHLSADWPDEVIP